MGTTTAVTRSPASKEARRQTKARKAGVTTLSEAEVDRYCKIWMKDYEKPQRLEVLRCLITEAWELVCYLTEAGLKFRSSSPEQAALTIAGCAYSEWMTTVVRDPAAYPMAADPAEIVTGFATGILWALWRGDGMPSLQADAYTWRAERSDSAIDRMMPLKVVAKLYPDMVKDGKLNLRRVSVQPVDPDACDACLWEPRPNILTSSIEEVKEVDRRCQLTSDRRRKKALAEKRSKAKPRAK